MPLGALRPLLALVLASACQSAPALSPQERARLGEFWDLFLSQDPSWKVRREEALADPTAREFLIQNLIWEVVRNTDATQSVDVARSPRSERAVEELAGIGAPAVPLLVALFPAKDPAVAAICASVSSRIGERAVPDLEHALEAKDPKIRRWSLHALAAMEPPRGEGLLLRSLSEDRDWTVRGTAAKELVRYQGRAVGAGLVRALEDPDPFVRREAAATLGSLRETSAVPALIRYLEASVRRPDLEEVQAALEALRGLTRKGFGPDPEVWRNWWEGGQEKG